MYANPTDLTSFFAPMPEMLPVYRTLEDRINETCGDVGVRVQKTQITFSDRFGFAWASLPVRRRRGGAYCCQKPGGLLSAARDMHRPGAVPAGLRGVPAQGVRPRPRRDMGGRDPGRHDHSIDAVRYAMMDDVLRG